MTQPPYDAVPIHLASAAPGIFPAAARPKTCRYHVIPRTVVLTTDEPAKQLLRPDPNREWATIIAHSNAQQTEVTPANPAAGAGFTYTNNTSLPQTLVTATYKLTTDAVVANRAPQLIIQDTAGNAVAIISTNVSTLASSSVRPVFGTGLAFSPSAGNPMFPLPNVLIQPGWQVLLTVSLMDPGDQMSNIVLTFAGAPGPGIVLTESKGDGQSAANVGDPSLANPNGGVIPYDTRIEIGSITSELWGAAATYPTRVTVMACYRKE